MRNISNNNRSISNGETSWEDGDFTDVAARKTFFKNLINRANSIPITFIFKLYGIRLSEYNKNTKCPFPSHKGGKENSASFLYYPETNSFYCFGCKTVGSCANFIANMDKTTLAKAAYKAIELFGSNSSSDVEFETLDISERLEIMMDFSNSIREFRQTNTDEMSYILIEKICQVYDSMNEKHKLDNESLRDLVNKLKTQIR